MLRKLCCQRVYQGIQLRYSFSEIKQSEEQSPKKLTKFQKQVQQQLIVINEKRNQEKKQGTQDYKAAILYEEILKKEIEIEIYNTRGRAFYVRTLANLAWLAFCGLVFYVYQTTDHPMSKLKKYTAQGCVVGIFFMRFIVQHRFCQHHVERLIYNTKLKEFSLIQRNMFGKKYTTQIKKDQLVYTDEMFFKRKFQNYIHLETLNTYSIGYRYAWRKKDLFAHLIDQNIKDLIW